MRFPGVTLDLVSPINPELSDRSVQSFPTTITSGAGASDRGINFGPLFKFCVLIDSLGNVIFPKNGATTFFFAFFLLLYDALFLTGSLILFTFNLV